MIKTVFQQLKKVVTSITLKDVVYLLVIALLLGAFSTAVSRCSDVKHQYKNNMKALNDTIRYYKDKNGNLVATKLAFESDLKTLKLLNEDLYNEIENLKAKGSVNHATYFSGVIENEVHDTTYIVKHDTISNGFTHDFNFNNEFRKLEGNVNYRNDSVGVKILKDEIKFDYTVAMDNKNNIYIHSTNPYVKYSEITGFQVPKPKNKRWYTGPSISAGYDPIQNKPSFSIGWSVGYGIIRW